MNIRLTARAAEGPEGYLPLDRHSLRAEILPPASGNTEETRIRVTSDAPFEGVIRIALGTGEPAAPARFVLPGFMYGTNRGDAPLVVDSKAPRLRADGGFPASPWWMVRSDRLSHPCAMMFTGGRILGLAASPYYVIRGGSAQTGDNNARTADRFYGLNTSYSLDRGFRCAVSEDAE